MEEDMQSRMEEFLRQFYEKELLEAASQGKKSVTVDFALLDKFSPDISDNLLNSPEIILDAARKAVEGVDAPDSTIKHIRFKNLPEHQNIRIRNLRSEHIGKFVCVDGVVRRASEVKPEVSLAIFECPDCSSRINVEQSERFLKTPSQCECGRKSGFRLVDRSLFDARWVVVEEPFEIATGDRPGEVSVYLKEDLTTPEMQRKTDPGNRLKINGVVKEIRKIAKGRMRTQMDVFIESNYIEPTEIEWEEVNITKEDEAEIRRLASDSEVYKKIVSSIAPSIYGMNEVKEAIMLQLFGGVPHNLPDRTRVRGDIHVLLLGDPSVAKCVTGETEVILADGSLKRIEDIVDSMVAKNKVEIDDGYFSRGNHDLVSLSDAGKVEPSKSVIFWKRMSPEFLYRIETSSGNKITVTPTHPMFICNSGCVERKPAERLRNGEFIAVPRKINVSVSKQEILLDIKRSKANNAVHIKVPKETSMELMRFLGYILSEGYAQKRGKTCMISFMNNSELLINDFADCVKNVFGANVYSRKPHKGKSSKEVYSCSSELYNFLEMLCSGLVKRSAEKEVPEIIFRCSDEEVKNFLRTFFDGEASVYRDGICVSSASEKMLKQIRTLLLRFEIMSYLHPTVVKGKTYWRLFITGPFAKVYADKIGFSLKHKKESLEKIKPRKNHYTNIDIIPNLSVVLKSVRTELKMSQFDFGIPRSTYQHFERGDRNPSRSSLQKIVKSVINRFNEIKVGDKRLAEKIARLEMLANSDIFWDKVKKIEKIKSDRKWVFDLQIDGVHNFVANNFFVHNSQLLKLISGIIPRGKYVSGRGATAAGLTATVLKDEEFMGGWVLEAGAMVLCHKGIIAIDEFDKMSKEDQIAMHEALEQQTISVAKASIVATLPAQVSVLAGANPKFSRFDPYRPIAEQIDIPDTLLSRFDLKFALRDIPEKEKDELLAAHILETRLKPESAKPFISPEFLRKYVAFARKNCHPVMTREAAERLKQFYVDMRGLYAGQDTVAITLRQNEALMRLAESSAKIQLRDEVNKEDANRAIAIMKYSLQQLGYDYETGRIDIDRTEGVAASQRSKIRILMDVIDRLERELGKQIPREDILAAAEEEGLRDVEDLLQKLKREGILFEPKLNTIQKA